jgi:hypothetical protein
MPVPALLRRRMTRRRFLVAAGVAAAGAVVLATGGSNGTPPSSGATSDDGLRRFRSRPDLSAPEFTVRTPPNGTAPGYLFLTPESGPLIAENSGNPIWIGDPGSKRIVNLHATTFRGEPALAWWEGTITGGHGQGEYVIADAGYQQLVRVRAGNGYSGDLHELVLTDQGTALITAYGQILGDHGQVYEGIVQEIDIESGRVLFEWHSHPAVAESESVIPRPTDPGQVYDYFHVNAIDVDTDGNLLVSARNTSALYKLDRRTGDILWRLNGQRSDYSVSDAASFSLQHDARRQPDGTISIFDDESGPNPSRGIVIAVDDVTRSVTLARACVEPDQQQTPAQGSVQLFPDRGMLVGWGNAPICTEFAADGTIRYCASFPAGHSSYRVRRAEWTGSPSERPAIAVEAGGGFVAAYASWNGATGIARWEILSGESGDRLQAVGSSPGAGFETTLPVNPAGPWFAARAIDASGAVMAQSEPQQV